MHLDTYTERLRGEVAAALDLLGGADARDADQGRRLLLALDPAVRLVLLESMSDAAAEISTLLPSAHVETRLRGRDVEFVAESLDPIGVDTEDSSPAPDGTDATPEAEESTDLTRVSLRLPEGLKARVEDLAAAQGQSLNSWLVDAVRRAAHTPPAPPVPPTPPSAPGGHLSSRRLTGWA